MFKAISLTMVIVVCAMAAAPALAGPVAPAPLTQDETAALIVADSQSTDAVGQVAAGMDQDTETFLTVAGVIIVAGLIIWWIF